MSSPVYYTQANDRARFVAHVFELYSDLITPARTVLVKPNLVSGNKYPTTTHPEMLAAVLKHLAGKEVVVADGPAVDARQAEQVIASSPLAKVCRSYDVPFLSLYHTPVYGVKSPRGLKYRIFRLPLEKDLVISLPVLKAHSCCHITGALKNQFGYLPRKERLAVHVLTKLGRDNLHKVIAEINLAAKPQLFIVDAVKTLIGCQEERHGGLERDLGYLLAGTDPVALDCFGLRLMQKVDPKLEGLLCSDITHVKYAEEYGVGSFSCEKIAVA